MLDFSVAAISVNDKITDAGAYAGFASVIGLAVLSVLYFAQARELKRLREWAGRAPERAAEMQERLAQQGGQAAAPQPRVVAQPRTPAAAPATAAGAGTAAGAPAPRAAPAGTPGVVPAAAGAGAATAAGAAAAAGSAGAAAPGTPGSVDTQKPSPATGTTTVDDQATEALPAVTAPAAGGTPPAAGPGASPSPAPAPRPEPAVPLRSAASPSAVPSLRRLGQDEPAPAVRDNTTRTVLTVVGGGLAAILVVILLVTQVFGGDDTPSRSADSGGQTQSAPETTTDATPSTPSTETSAPVADIVRADYEVTVLNGTSVNNAARQAADKLETTGYKVIGAKSAVTNTVTKTTVSFQPKSKRAAIDIASKLGLPVATVVEATPDDVVAGLGAKVIVTLGSDTVKPPA